MPKKFLPAKPVCRHCQKRLANSRKGFCRICYDMPGVKDYYDHLAELSALEDQPPPVTPTSTLPGSPLKIEIMQMRAMRGVSVFHLRDFDPDLA